MKLIEQIRESAVDAKHDIATLLRRAKVLAVMLRNDDLRQWVSHELEGYPVGADLPSYRRAFSPPMGNFSGSFGRHINNYLLHVSMMPTDLRERAVTIEFRQPVKELSALLASNSDGLRLGWPPETVMALQERMELSGDFILVEAYQPITKAHLEGILDAVRNRLLDLVLALEELDPGVATSDRALTGLETQIVERLVSVNIFGDQNVVASGTNISQHVDNRVSPNDANSLAARLTDLGVHQEDLQELQGAIASDGQPEKGRFGPGVSGWLGRLLSKSAAGAWDVAKAAAPTLITKALAQYYGWGT